MVKKVKQLGENKNNCAMKEKKRATKDHGEE